MVLLFGRMALRGLPTMAAHRLYIDPPQALSTAAARNGLAEFYGGPRMQRLTDSLDFQSQALVLRAERQRLIASNIANADTPGYQAREMDFASALRQATSSGANPVTAAATATQLASTALHTTHPLHDDAAVGLQSEAGLLYARHSQDAIDRNTVELDRERASFVDNSVKYEATLRFISGSLRSMLDAMKSPNQG